MEKVLAYIASGKTGGLSDRGSAGYPGGTLARVLTCRPPCSVNCSDAMKIVKEEDTSRHGHPWL
jgi:hypothetical protein